MINKLIKKIGFICLGLASLALAGCFHIPDEDWLPSRNKVETGNIQKESEVDEAINSFMDGINMISSQRDDLNSEEINEVISEEVEESSIEVEDKTSENEEAVDNKETIDGEIQKEESSSEK